MAERFVIVTRGGPHPGSHPSPSGMAWPLPQEIPGRGGAYVKVSESKLPPIPPGFHLVRGAVYVWRPTARERKS